MPPHLQIIIRTLSLTPSYSGTPPLPHLPPQRTFLHESFRLCKANCKEQRRTLTRSLSTAYYPMGQHESIYGNSPGLYAVKEGSKEWRKAHELFGKFVVQQRTRCLGFFGGSDFLFRVHAKVRINPSPPSPPSAFSSLCIGLSLRNSLPLLSPISSLTPPNNCRPKQCRLATPQ